MSKIAIISQPEQGVLIDLTGCTDVHQATQHLTSTLQGQSQFWEDSPVDLNLADLQLSADEFSQVLAIFDEVGLKPRHFYCAAEETKAALAAHDLVVATGEPQVAKLSPEQSATADSPEAKQEDEQENEPGTADSAKPAVPHVLYLRQTLRSGQTISHKGNVVIIGDVNPGAEVVAEGDITIWGALRGLAHAGIAGNTGAEIRALRFDPIQLRIAHAIARAPDRKPGSHKNSGPETARVVDGIIRISSCAPD